jgi:formylglycine-generating enzyme required for sulfatase activity
VTSVTWYEAAKFVNWLNTSTGSVPAYKFDVGGNFQLWTPSDAGYDANNLYRNKLAKYFLPTVHEYHKAAFYDPNSGTYYTYTTASNNLPDGIDFPGDPVFDAVFYDGGLNASPNLIGAVGVAGPYGTFGQGGNVHEWLETASDFVNSAGSESRIQIGGSWVDDAGFLSSDGFTGSEPQFDRPYTGFRVDSIVPEPSIVTLTVIGVSLSIGYLRQPRGTLRSARG